MPTDKATNGNRIARYFNRELSWLAFNRRVMEEAQNTHHPLLERVRFLAISDHNLDEFYMVRVAGLKSQVEAGIDTLSPDGLSPEKQLAAINQKASAMVALQSEIWATLAKDLAKHDIALVTPEQLKEGQKRALKKHFLTRIFPALTPLAVDPAHPFPFITNDGLAIVLKLFDLEDKTLQWALIPLPRKLERFIPIKNQPGRFILLESVVSLYLDELFPGYEVQGQGLFHLIRGSEMALDEEADDLIQMFKSALKQRRRGSITRLMVNEDMSPDMLSFVLDELQTADDDVFQVKGLMNLEDLEELVRLNRPELKFPLYTPRIPAPIKKVNGDIFEAIRHRGDIIVHHPYESFDVVVDFLEQAAEDPQVLAIKQTLYRTSKDSPIVRALIEAAEAGKSVAAVVELKARFDEAENIRLAEKLERAGVQVVYGFIDTKTHCKLSLVVRQEGENIRNYVHFGTGNYHPITAKIYTDLSLFTDDEVLARDAARVFNLLTGYAFPDNLRKLVIAPRQMQKKLLSLIQGEINHVKAGRPGTILAKMNALVDPKVIDALYKASQAGVHIRLVVRGICCLKPGVPGLSDNIQVTSIVGRFLEHARVVCFGNGYDLLSSTISSGLDPHHANPTLENMLAFISSADWMPRNFHSRVETLVPVDNLVVKALLFNVMQANLRDTLQSWRLDGTGVYHRLVAEGHGFGVHQYFMTHTSSSGLPGEGTSSS